ncbi:MAG: peptide chain release factor N(5)-glutamine methyltransferase [Flavobacteriaceae bacterium]|nr:peptide chain release factor N(5)-glutamine methyltransferase [Flavobacteriaceae bacterium]
MELKALKTYFSNSLKGYYPKEEIESFFFIVAAFYLGYERIDVSLNANASVSAEHYNQFQDVIDELKVYQPIQYLLGETEFFGLPFKVSNAVLIPRPETEELVDWIVKTQNLKFKREDAHLGKALKVPNRNVTSSGAQQLHILDIGTGSGCIAISLAKNIPHAKVYALDVSEKALEVAKQNAEQNGVELTFIKGDVLDKESVMLRIAEYQEQFDIIVSNPPYVRQLEKKWMHNNVLNYEPHLALFVDDDNALVFYKAIAAMSLKLLKNKGLLFFEINEYLGNPMKMLLSEYGFHPIELRQDINQKNRMIKTQKL